MGYDEAFVPFAVAAITPLGCAWVASRFVPPTNKWVYGGVIVGTAYLSWKYIVPRMLTSMGYPVPFDAESFSAYEEEDKNYSFKMSRVCASCDKTMKHNELSGLPHRRLGMSAKLREDDAYYCRDCWDSFRKADPDWDAESFSEAGLELRTAGRCGCEQDDLWEVVNVESPVFLCSTCGYAGNKKEDGHFMHMKNIWNAESFAVEWDEDGYAEKQARYLRRIVENAMRNGCWDKEESMEIIDEASDLGMSIVESDYFRNREAESFSAESKFVKPYDRRGKIDFRRDNKGRYRRKLSVPLKKSAEWERLTTTLSEISAKRSMVSMKGKAHHSPNYLGVKKVDWKVAPYDEVASDEVWGVFRKLS